MGVKVHYETNNGIGLPIFQMFVDSAILWEDLETTVGLNSLGAKDWVQSQTACVPVALAWKWRSETIYFLRMTQ